MKIKYRVLESRYSDGSVRFFPQNHDWWHGWRFYANFQWKRTRFFLMMYNVNQSSSGSGYFLAPHYPINPRMLKLGISWNFFD